MDEQSRQAHLDAIETDGYTILQNVITPERIDALKKRVREIERDSLGDVEADDPKDETSFLRTGGLLRIDPLFWDVPIEPDVLEVLEGALGADFLLSTFSALDVQPHRQNSQPLHPDDALIPLARPHAKPIGCTCMFIITDFNEQTGGTRLIPGSHRWPLDLLFSQDPAQMEGVIQPDMKAGSVLIFDHALFHGACTNTTDEWRLGLQVSYHAGWIRPYTNWFRSVPIEEAREFPQKLTDLMGYKTLNGIGSAGQQTGSYRESYTGKRGARDPRISMD